VDSRAGSRLQEAELPPAPRAVTMLTLVHGWPADAERWLDGVLAHTAGHDFEALLADNSGDPDVAARLYAERGETMYCFPRNVDSVAFYTDRDDLKSCRTRVSQELVEELIQHDRSVVLFTHRHSLDTFKQVLPPQLKVTDVIAVKAPGKGGQVLDNLVGDGAWGLCHVAVVERVQVRP